MHSKFESMKICIMMLCTIPTYTPWPWKGSCKKTLIFEEAFSLVMPWCIYSATPITRITEVVIVQSNYSTSNSFSLFNLMSYNTHL